LAQDQDDRPPDSEQVAILGFTNLGGDPALAWIGPGTVESVRADLGSLGLRVVSAATVQAALAGHDETPNDPDRTASEIGAALGARWVVSGGYQRLGTRLRLTARLYDTTSDGEASVIRSEGLREDLFDLQDQIAEQLGARMRPGSRVSEPAVSVASTGGFRTSAAVIDGPPPPQPPAVITRNAAGRATIRAIRIAEPLRIDGTLDERIYQDVAGPVGFRPITAG
jgi:TolB-like protein